MEEWKQVSGYTGCYEVSNMGRVRSLDRVTIDTLGRKQKHSGRVIRGSIDKQGYRRVILCKRGQEKCTLVHILVAKAFLGPRPSLKHEVNHDNGIKNDNRVSNLEWMTPKENTNHAMRTGLRIKNGRGDKNYACKVSDRDVAEILKRHKLGETQQSLADEFGINQATVSKYVRGTKRQWQAWA